MRAIVNVNQNWGIGKNGDLLCSFKEDFSFFKEKTEGAIVIYGRKTLYTFPRLKPLKNRFNILLTHDEEKTTENLKKVYNEENLNFTMNADIGVSCFVFIDEPINHDNINITPLLILQDLESLKCSINTLEWDDSVYIIGGESIYKQFLPLCDTVYVTKNSCDIEADSFFPNLDEDPEWEIIESSGKKISESKPDITYEFLTYKKNIKG